MAEPRYAQAASEVVVRWLIRLSVWCALLAFLSGCESEPDIPSFDGNYRSTLADGREVRLTVVEKAGAVAVRGQIGDEALVAALPITRRASGSAQTSGATSVDLALAPVAGGIDIWGSEFGGVTLEPDPDPPDFSAGTFEGRYEALSDLGVVATFDISHHDAFVVGTGDVFGAPVGLAGRTTDVDRVRASVTFRDGSEMPVVMTRRDDGSLDVRGLTGVGRLERL